MFRFKLNFTLFESIVAALFISIALAMSLQASAAESLAEGTPKSTIDGTPKSTIDGTSKSTIDGTAERAGNPADIRAERRAPAAASSDLKAAGTAPIYKSGQHIEAGISYLQWNESFTLLKGADSSKGYASYAGPGLQLEYSRGVERWVYGVTGTIAGGKAAAGGFKTGYNFSDGVDRLWYGWFVNPFVQFRVNPQVKFGFGALARSRSIDWTPGDTTLKNQERASLAYAPTFHMRWTLSNRVTIAQTFALIGPDSETQWDLALQYICL